MVHFIYMMLLWVAQSEKSFYRGFLINGKKHLPRFKKTYPYLSGLKYKEIYLKDN